MLPSRVHDSYVFAMLSTSPLSPSKMFPDFCPAQDKSTEESSGMEPNSFTLMPKQLFPKSLLSHERYVTLKFKTEMFFC